MEWGRHRKSYCSNWSLNPTLNNLVIVFPIYRINYPTYGEFAQKLVLQQSNQRNIIQKLIANTSVRMSCSQTKALNIMRIWLWFSRLSSRVMCDVVNVVNFTLRNDDDILYYVRAFAINTHSHINNIRFLFVKTMSLKSVPIYWMRAASNASLLSTAHDVAPISQKPAS